MAQVDAAQFSKAASRERGYRRAKILFGKLSKRTGMDAIAVRRIPKAEGFLCKASRKDTYEHQTVPFSTILHALSYARHDNFFLVGDCILERLIGWAMGAPMSEPITGVDLGDDVSQLYSSSKVQARAGWVLPGMSILELIDGAQHVDDALVCSLVFCSQ